MTSSTPLWVLWAGFLPTGGIALPLIPLGIGLGFSLAGPTIAVQNDAPPAEVGAAIGLTRFLQSLGGALGFSLLTVFATGRFQALSAGATTQAGITKAMVATYNEIFLLLSVCIAIAFGFALFFVGRIPQKSPESNVRHET